MLKAYFSILPAFLFTCLLYIAGCENENQNDNANRKLENFNINNNSIENNNSGNTLPDYNNQTSNIENITESNNESNNTANNTANNNITNNSNHNISNSNDSTNNCEPTDEICDGFDNDCDGTVDEGHLCGLNYICSNGECSEFCSPEEEICDEIDNDCDNEIDEGELCGTGYICEEGACIFNCLPYEEICDGRDNDCDNEIDEGDLCGTGYLCQNGECKLDCIPADEVCDGIDNDCDDEIDEEDEALLCIFGESCKDGQCTPNEEGCDPEDNKFIVIHPGTFMMGSPSNENGRNENEVQHSVTLTYAFEIQKTEVTQGQFESLMGYNNSSYSSCGQNCPVEKISWDETLAYCNALSRDQGAEECFSCVGTAPSVECDLRPEFEKPYECLGYRLPTEAEWEYSARAGTSTAFYSTGNIAWFRANSDMRTHVVCLKEPNLWGLYDMTGNVWEWCWDLYQPDYGIETVNPYGGGDSPYRVLRGCSWGNDIADCRTASRAFNHTYTKGSNIGFRPVRTLNY